MIFGVNDFWGQQIFMVKKMLGAKKLWVKFCGWSKSFGGQQILGVKKGQKSGSTKLWVKSVGGQKKLGVKKGLESTNVCGKKMWV